MINIFKKRKTNPTISTISTLVKDVLLKGNVLFYDKAWEECFQNTYDNLAMNNIRGLIKEDLVYFKSYGVLKNLELKGCIDKALKIIDTLEKDKNVYNQKLNCDLQNLINNILQLINFSIATPMKVLGVKNEATKRFLKTVKDHGGRVVTKDIGFYKEHIRFDFEDDTFPVTYDLIFYLNRYVKLFNYNCKLVELINKKDLSYYKRNIFKDIDLSLVPDFIKATECLETAPYQILEPVCNFVEKFYLPPEVF